MSVSPHPPHQNLAVDHASTIVQEDSRLTGSEANSGTHSQDSSFSTDGPSTPKDEKFADRADKVAIAGIADTVAGINEPELKREPVEPDEEDEEDDDDDDDDDFIPRGGPSRPTGAGGGTAKPPVRAR